MATMATTQQLPPAPRRIAVGVRVQERKKKEDARIGTVIRAEGLRLWDVQFDDEDGTEVKSSGGALRIYMGAYGKQDTPKKSLATSVQPAPPKTGRVRKANTKTNGGSGSTSEGSVENYSDDDDDFPGTERSVVSSDNSDARSSEESASNSFSFGEHSDTASSSPPRSKRSRKKKKSLFSSAKKVLSQHRRGGRKKGTSLQGTRLFTPRPLSEDDSSSLSGIPCDNAVFTPEEGEGFDDAFEEEEDDNGKGDARVMQDSEAHDGARVEFIDCPQKSELYHAAKKKMEKEKESLIGKKHTIRVEVKTKHAYKFGGRVEGRKSTDFAGCRGTIIDIIDVNDKNDRYMIQW